MPNLKLKRFIYLYFCNPIGLVSADVTENRDLHHPHIQYPTIGRSSEFVATVNNQFGPLKKAWFYQAKSQAKFLKFKKKKRKQKFSWN